MTLRFVISTSQIEYFSSPFLFILEVVSAENSFVLFLKVVVMHE